MYRFDKKKLHGVKVKEEIVTVNKLYYYFFPNKINFFESKDKILVYTVKSFIFVGLKFRVFAFNNEFVDI